MSSTGFYQITLAPEGNLFSELKKSIDFEPVAKGRIGNHLVKVEERGVPIVRTTTKYNIPAHHFSTIHHMIVDGINDAIGKNNLAGLSTQQYNNALIEVYGSSYFKMNFHSDQSLDLDGNSCIALFTCYEDPDALSAQHIRKLKIRDKVSEEEFEYSLTHNSVMLFSVATNTKFHHKIVLDGAPNLKPGMPDNKWLGITFRQSKTYIRFEDDVPRFSNGTRLKMANKEQESEFYKLRGQENRSLDFSYPELAYTINPGDMLLPKNSQ